MKKLLVISSMLVVFFVLPTVHAANSTPSADIRSKLEELKKNIASKAAKLKLEVNRKLKDKAYIGKVKSQSSNTLTLATKNGPKLVNINQDTVFFSSLSKKYSQKNIEEEDYLAALGDVDETGVLTAKKIVDLPTPSTQTKIFLWGQIISVSDKLVTLKDRNLKSIAVSKPFQSSIKTLDFVILSGVLGKNDIFEAKFIYIIPKEGILKPKKVATPSASTKPISR